MTDAPPGGVHGARGARASARAHIGISGWVYPRWRKAFYPDGLRQADELKYASQRLTSIEVNGSFYSLQKPANWTRWRDTVPGDFVFAVKGPRFVTHIKRLRDIEAPLANFFASGVLALGGKLGPVLWQLPPTLAFDEELLEAFLARLPRTMGAAADLAAGHDERMEGRSWFAIDELDGADTGVAAEAGDAAAAAAGTAARPLRHAVEVRHASFENEAWTELLARHGVASVVADTAGRYPRLTATTADFAYARLHGEEELYASGYDDASLDRWADWARAHLAAGRDAFVYFDNDAKVRAPFDAMSLIARLRA